jgi:hypothetical protein
MEDWMECGFESRKEFEEAQRYGCGAYGPRHETEDGAITGWNKRT